MTEKTDAQVINPKQPAVSFFDLDGVSDADVQLQKMRESYGKDLSFMDEEPKPEVQEPQGEEVKKTPEENPQEKQPEDLLEPDEGEEEEEKLPGEVPAQTPEAQSQKQPKKPWERVKELKKDLRSTQEENASLKAKLDEIEAKQRAFEEREIRREEEARQREAERLKAQSQKHTEEEPIPELEADPLGHITGTQRQIQKTLEEMKQDSQKSKEQQQWEGVLAQVDREEQGFMREHEDYYEALQHVLAFEQRQLQLRGYQGEALQQKMIQRRVEVIAETRQSRKNIAETIYEYAKLTGFQGRAKTQAQEEDQEEVQAQRESKEREKVQRTKEREIHAKSSPASIPRSPAQPDRPISREAVIGMGQDEMDARERDDPGWALRLLQQRRAS